MAAKKLMEVRLKNEEVIQNGFEKMSVVSTKRITPQHVEVAKTLLAAHRDAQDKSSVSVMALPPQPQPQHHHLTFFS